MGLAAIACPIATETAATSGVDIGVIVNTFPDTMDGVLRREYWKVLP
jgi:hypothetical protein